VLVAQFSNSTTYDNVALADPFMMLIPPYEQFLSKYTLTTPASGFVSYMNVVVANAGVGGVVVDGVTVPTAKFTSIGTSGFSGAQLPIGVGSHTLSGTLPFGSFIYGFAQADGYGYPGGMSLSPVAVVTTLQLLPKTATNPVGTQDCVTATVLDQSSNPVKNVRVDFAVSGPNATLGFTNTAADGTAKFCYSGASAGTDTIVASVGSVTDSATKTWTAAPPPAPPSCALTQVIAGPPKQLQITVQDSTVGIQSIQVTDSTNASVAVPAFTPGDTSAMLVVATKTDQSQGAHVALSITGVDGQVTNCDPVVPADDLASSNLPPDSAGGCSVGRTGAASNLYGLLAALAGLAFFRRRRGATR
jgi:MYXO-CTERM domain-containing protein